jgi:hypothetical protein
MKLSAVLLARVVGLVEVADLNPRGKVRYPALTDMLIKHFDFKKFPQKPEEFDETKGIEFVEGLSPSGLGIDKLTVWHNGIGLDVRSSTTDAKKIIEESLSWLKQEAGLSYAPGMIKRWAYLSQLTVYSDANFERLNTAVSALSKRLTLLVSELQGSEFDYRPAGINLSFDRTAKPLPVADFTFQRRIDAPFSDNKYYSQAPLPTDAHISLLENFEADVLKTIVGNSNTQK